MSPVRPLLLLLAIPGAACSPDAGAPAGEATDVLIVVIDDVSERDLEETVELPFLESLGERGLRFRRAYAYPSCSPSRYALLFGRHPFRGGVGGVLRVGEGPGAELSAPSLARVFGDAGYATGLFGKWHLSTAPEVDVVQQHVTETGFDVWRAGVAYGSESYHRWPRMEDGVLSEETGYETDVQTDSLLSWWRATAGPRFAVLSYQALHTPYEEPPTGREGFERSGTGNWHAMAAHLDGRLRDVVEAVDLERTLVVILADNGTAPGVGVFERGRTKPTVYEGGIHVPLFALGRGVEARGDTDALVGVVDVAATVAEVAGVRVPEGAFGDSVSFASALETGRGTRRLLYTQRFKPGGFGPRELEEEAALDAEGRKLIRFLDGREEAYDVRRDPFEHTPLALDAPELAPLRARLDELGE